MTTPALAVNLNRTTIAVPVDTQRGIIDCSMARGDIVNDAATNAIQHKTASQR